MSKCVQNHHTLHTAFCGQCAIFSVDLYQAFLDLFNLLDYLHYNFDSLRDADCDKFDENHRVFCDLYIVVCFSHFDIDLVNARIYCAFHLLVRGWFDGRLLEHNFKGLLDL